MKRLFLQIFAWLAILLGHWAYAAAHGQPISDGAEKHRRRGNLCAGCRSCRPRRARNPTAETRAPTLNCTITPAKPTNSEFLPRDKAA